MKFMVTYLDAKWRTGVTYQYICRYLGCEIHRYVDLSFFLLLHSQIQRFFFFYILRNKEMEVTVYQ